MTQTQSQAARSRERVVRKERRRLNRVVKLAADRWQLDLLCAESYELLAREDSTIRRGPGSPVSPGVLAVIRYTMLDDRWVERRERLPTELTAAFDAATALVRLVATSALLLHETGGRA